MKLITLAQAAAELGVSKRWFQYWLADHPMDRSDVPFYVPIGRNKRFDLDDIGRIRSVIWEQQHTGFQPGWIYVAGFANYIKIGFTSKSIEERIASLQTACPEVIVLYASMKGSLELEAQLHKRFSAFVTQGEWFRHEGELAEWIKGGCK